MSGKTGIKADTRRQNAKTIRPCNAQPRFSCDPMQFTAQRIFAMARVGSHDNGRLRTAACGLAQNGLHRLARRGHHDQLRGRGQIRQGCDASPTLNLRIAWIDEIDLSGKTALEQIGENGMTETAGPCTGADQRKACRCKKSLKTSYRHICLACEFRDRLIDPDKSALRCDKLGRGIKEAFNASLAMTGEISCAILARLP